MEHAQLVKDLFDKYIEQVMTSCGGFPDMNLQNLPNYRAPKFEILKKIPKESTLQMVPKLPPNIKEETGADYSKRKVSANFLDDKKQ